MDIKTLNQKMEDLKNGASASMNQDFNAPTGLNDAQSQAIKVYTSNGTIVVENAQTYSIFNAAGQRVAADQKLPNGAYIVVANGQTFKVAL